jgi:hypothetical protein
MNTNHIESQFATMGARFRARIVPENRRSQSDYAMDIQRDRHREFFELRVPGNLSDQLDVGVLQVRPRGAAPPASGATRSTQAYARPLPVRS